MLSMHEQSPGRLELMLSLSMLILATYPVAAWEGTIRTKVKTDIPKFEHVEFWPKRDPN